MGHPMNCLDGGRGGNGPLPTARLVRLEPTSHPDILHGLNNRKGGCLGGDHTHAMCRARLAGQWWGWSCSQHLDAWHWIHVGMPLTELSPARPRQFRHTAVGPGDLVHQPYAKADRVVAGAGLCRWPAAGPASRRRRARAGVGRPSSDGCPTKSPLALAWALEQERHPKWMLTAQGTWMCLEQITSSSSQALEYTVMDAPATMHTLWNHHPHSHMHGDVEGRACSTSGGPGNQHVTRAHGFLETWWIQMPRQAGCMWTRQLALPRQPTGVAGTRWLPSSCPPGLGYPKHGSHGVQFNLLLNIQQHR